MIGEPISEDTGDQLPPPPPPPSPPLPPFHPHQCLGVGVGLLVHDDLCHLVVAAVGGHVQRRQVVVGHVVHGNLMVQQQLDAVEVVALSRHVEGRQAILEARRSEWKTQQNVKCWEEWILRGHERRGGHRLEVYLGLWQYRSSSVQQHPHHLLMAAPGSTVERSQTVLWEPTGSFGERRAVRRTTDSDENRKAGITPTTK